MVYISEGEKDTVDFACKMAKKAMPGDIITLKGDLGTGKTVFAKGFAKGLGIKETVNSPTFTLVHEYKSGRIPLYHFDAYRISSPEEMQMAGLEEYLFSEGICLIEWPQVVEELLPGNIVRVEIKKTSPMDFNKRIITVEEGK